MSDTTSYWKGLCDLETFRESPAGLCQNDLLRREVLNDDVVAGATKMQVPDLHSSEMVRNGKVKLTATNVLLFSIFFYCSLFPISNSQTLLMSCEI